MKTRERRSIGELLLLIFIALLLLYSLYLNIFEHEDVKAFSIFASLILAVQAVLYYFRSEYELTEEALLIHERWPLRDKRIPYEDVVRYKIIFYRMGSEARRKTPRDVMLVYRKGKRGKSVMICPEDPDNFAGEFQKMLQSHAVSAETV
ncbi:MAG: hypothetical protein J5496_00130 [Lachnospiraceae bacterium]|nr:hypothetical protein [Lachnospiraceae bacterium]